jgi:hypothetical protein
VFIAEDRHGLQLLRLFGFQTGWHGGRRAGCSLVANAHCAGEMELFLSGHVPEPTFRIGRRLKRIWYDGFLIGKDAIVSARFVHTFNAPLPYMASVHPSSCSMIIRRDEPLVGLFPAKDVFKHEPRFAGSDIAFIQFLD